MIKGMDQENWSILIQNIAQGECTPLLGPEACLKALPRFCSSAQEWAAQHGYPLEDSNDLARVAEFLAIRRPMAPKEMIRDRLAANSQIDFDADDEPHGVLAGLPLPVYITTNYDDCMMLALGRKRKPQRELCKWNESLAGDKFPLDTGFVPSVQQPLVFHLLGHYARLQSLVLTEDDYLDFLVNISSGNYALPALIQERLTNTSLLCLGYRLNDWSFRVLLRSLFAHKPVDQRGISVTVQMPSDASTPERRNVETYLEDYLKQKNLLVVWGATGEFIQELGRRCRAAGIRVPDSTAPAAASGPVPAMERLRENLAGYFSEGDQRNLCFDLSANYDALPGSGTDAKAREIILYFANQGRLDVLIAACKQRRQNLNWEFQQ